MTWSMIRNILFDRNVERLIAPPLGEQESRGWRIEALTEQSHMFINESWQLANVWDEYLIGTVALPGSIDDLAVGLEISTVENIFQHTFALTVARDRIASPRRLDLCDISRSTISITFLLPVRIDAHHNNFTHFRLGWLYPGLAPAVLLVVSSHDAQNQVTYALVLVSFEDPYPVPLLGPSL